MNKYHIQLVDKKTGQFAIKQSLELIKINLIKNLNEDEDNIKEGIEYNPDDYEIKVVKND